MGPVEIHRDGPRLRSGNSSVILPLVTALVLAGAPQWLGPKPAAAPKRVVTLAPSLTATVLALGKRDALVGVSRFDEAPEVAKLKRVGGFNDPSVEAVVALKADLVLVQMGPANQKPVEKMAELGIPVLAVGASPRDGESSSTAARAVLKVTPGGAALTVAF